MGSRRLRRAMIASEGNVPTYQYACTACGHELEAVQSFSDDPLTQCPTCEGRLRKVFGSVGVVFKGSGFYRTDSRAAANGGNGAKPAEAGAGKDQGKKDPGGTDSASKDAGSNGSGGKDSKGTKDKAATTPAASASTS